jgi:hypothetical protein
VDERAYYTESQATKPATLHCPFCKSSESYELRWMVRKKKDRLPPGADERDRARFQKSQSYMVLLDDKVACKNLRCRKRFDISGVKSMAFLSEFVTPTTRSDLHRSCVLITSPFAAYAKPPDRGAVGID